MENKLTAKKLRHTAELARRWESKEDAIPLRRDMTQEADTMIQIAELVAEHIMQWKRRGASARWDERAENLNVEHIVGHYGGWSPGKDISAAYQMEEKIKERGLKEIYVAALAFVVGGVNSCIDVRNGFVTDVSSPDLFALIHATPKQRCLAALRAVGVEVEV